MYVASFFQVVSFYLTCTVRNVTQNKKYFFISHFFHPSHLIHLENIKTNWVISFHKLSTFKQIWTLRSEKEDGNVDVGTWKSVHDACAKSRKTLLLSSVARDGREKVSCDVLMKTCNILSKIMVILDIHGITVLTIFTAEYHTTFFEFILKDWACIKCFACFFGLITIFCI